MVVFGYKQMTINSNSNCDTSICFQWYIPKICQSVRYRT